MHHAIIFSCILWFFGTVGCSTVVEVLTECGQTLNAMEGRIEYKLNQTYDAGEICAFIIRTPEYCDFIWRLESHGINDADPNAIYIAGLAAGGVNGAYELGPPEPFPSIVSSGYGAVVIFRTNTNLGTGFNLSYTAEKLIDGEWLGMDFVFNNATENSTSNLDLPVSDNLTGAEHSTVVVVTSEAKLIADPEYSLKMSFSEEFDNIDFCRTFVRPYVLLEEGLEGGTAFCGDGPIEYKSQRLILAVFATDGTITGDKGKLSWEVVKYSSNK